MVISGTTDIPLVLVLKLFVRVSRGICLNERRNLYQGLYSLSGKTSYRKISWSLEAARFGFKLFQSLWNLAGTSAALLPRCLSNFTAIRPLQHPISRHRDFTRFGGKTSYRLVNRGPCVLSYISNTLPIIKAQSYSVRAQLFWKKRKCVLFLFYTNIRHCKCYYG